MTDTLANDYGMKCPQCGASDRIDVAATVWVSLCRDGTDVYRMSLQRKRSTMKKVF